MSYVKELEEKHKEMGVKRFHVSLGDGNPTAEQVAKEILSVYWQVERGHTASHDSFYEDGAPLTDVKYYARELRAWFNRTRDKALGIKNPYANIQIQR